MWQTVVDFLWEGMVHLWIGYDHMLFLLALVLPAAVRREKGRWVVEDSLVVAVKDVALIVTAFTVAHSVTLVIATLGVVRLPIEWVETFIALSIVAAAVNIVWPFLGRRRYLVGFGFGLIHGFGFASVLSDFLTDTSSRLIALASFNIGVELAQLVVVACVVPIIFLLRRQWLYQRVVLPVGVVAIAAIGSVWVWERVPL
ncbi:MAG: HupE/UreJ family protein [Pseudomonas sp.]|nr:HupE/UreJ family protein [Pseudomonas sp.]